MTKPKLSLVFPNYPFFGKDGRLFRYGKSHGTGIYTGFRTLDACMVPQTEVPLVENDMRQSSKFFYSFARRVHRTIIQYGHVRGFRPEIDSDVSLQPSFCKYGMRRGS